MWMSVANFMKYQDIYQEKKPNKQTRKQNHLSETFMKWI